VWERQDEWSDEIHREVWIGLIALWPQHRKGGQPPSNGDLAAAVSALERHPTRWLKKQEIADELCREVDTIRKKVGWGRLDRCEQLYGIGPRVARLPRVCAPGETVPARGWVNLPKWAIAPAGDGAFLRHAVEWALAEQQSGRSRSRRQRGRLDAALEQAGLDPQLVYRLAADRVSRAAPRLLGESLPALWYDAEWRRRTLALWLNNRPKRSAHGALTGSCRCENCCSSPLPQQHSVPPAALD
jgi:hypothetical protein